MSPTLPFPPVILFPQSYCLPSVAAGSSTCEESCFLTPAIHPTPMAPPNCQDFSLVAVSACRSLVPLCREHALPRPPSRYSPLSFQLAIRRYKLFNLRAEFFLNTCDLPSSYDSSVLPVHKAGMPVFSTESLPGSIDILYPDPLDLTGGYIAPGKKSVSNAQLMLSVGRTNGQSVH